jgi:hypothetical protein
MNKAEAEKIARKMIKRNVPAWANQFSVARAANSNKLLTPHATRKVLVTFRALALKSPKYQPLEKMWLEDNPPIKDGS